MGTEDSGVRDTRVLRCRFGDLAAFQPGPVEPNLRGASLRRPPNVFDHAFLAQGRPCPHHVALTQRRVGGQGLDADGIPHRQLATGGEGLPVEAIQHRPRHHLVAQLEPWIGANRRLKPSNDSAKFYVRFAHGAPVPSPAIP
ncbi:hypothetical protein Sp245p_14310 [Azospirillum baldaniorum]|uniref:hypothetical protein n=1 Tax=Azospirillum baldaniorum TaxID=1064539 RepID=UPI000D6002F7|nr:hypothetical protein [Azospirillum baldaniorum]AWJ90882.1 hypothetical protein Sp245p_14310 [Azospirillum baldaniorum]